ncbi:hypothetical protein PtrM4_106920 [Pyrenophora tritici-repentis]|uniref:Uncharacterized protein n=1 Tax=Pyrenophora tritici-repentis TaxID=45151 RepID=A0A834RVT1_9PLEO|nr:hypothetical protein PtrM4_106920 [Pyrenophora tritici-repentis]
MRIFSEDHIVCGTRSGQGSPFMTRFDQTASDTDHSGPCDQREDCGLGVEETLIIQPHTPKPKPPHGPANQPATDKLVKTFPSSIRSRVRSFTDAEPLAFRWKFPVNKRYRVKDEEAFAALREKNIEWYVTTGLLKEDHLGLQWAAGDYTYLLYWHHDWMPTPAGVDSTCRGLHIAPEFIREWQVGNWEKHFADVVLEDRPATPFVDQSDSSIAPLFLWKGSALSKCRVPPPLSSDSDAGSPVRGKRVRLHREKSYRILELAMDDSGVPVEEEGKVVETKIDETAILTDNEGKTVKSWLRMLLE